MAYNQTECIALVQKAVNLLKNAQEWDNRAQIKAQALSLQGEKRREGYDERSALCLMQALQRMTYDRFGVEIFPIQATIEFPTMTEPVDYFKGYHAELWRRMDILHDIANQLVVLKYRRFAKPIYEYVDCIDCEIVDVRRQMRENDLAGWEFHHISRYQVGYENRHDDYESKEKKQGYGY